MEDESINIDELINSLRFSSIHDGDTTATNRVVYSKQWKKSLYCKVLCMDRTIRFKTFQNTILNIWAKFGVKSVSQAQIDIFLVEFSSSSAVNSVLEEGPWTIQNDFILTHKVVPDLQLSDYKFENLDMWIQLHNIPLNYLVPAVVINLLNGLGEILPIDPLGVTRWKSYARVRMKIHPNFCIKVVARSKLSSGEYICAKIKYERLTRFCHVCCRVGHEDLTCSIRKKVLKTINSCTSPDARDTLSSSILPKITDEVKANNSFYSSSRYNEEPANQLSPDSRNKSSDLEDPAALCVLLKKDAGFGHSPLEGKSYRDRNGIQAQATFNHCTLSETANHQRKDPRNSSPKFVGQGDENHSFNVENQTFNVENQFPNMDNQSLIHINQRIQSEEVQHPSIGISLSQSNHLQKHQMYNPQLNSAPHMPILCYSELRTMTEIENSLEHNIFGAYTHEGQTAITRHIAAAENARSYSLATGKGSDEGNSQKDSFRNYKLGSVPQVSSGGNEIQPMTIVEDTLGQNNTGEYTHEVQFSNTRHIAASKKYKSYCEAIGNVPVKGNSKNESIRKVILYSNKENQTCVRRIRASDLSPSGAHKPGVQSSCVEKLLSCAIKPACRPDGHLHPSACQSSRLPWAVAAASPATTYLFAAYIATGGRPPPYATTPYMPSIPPRPRRSTI